MNTPLSTLVSLALTATLTAQLPEWTSIPYSNATKSFFGDTLVGVQEAGRISCFSSFTRSWSVLPVSASAQFTGYEDHAIVQDGPMFWGYSARTASFAALVTANGGLNASATAVWLSVVTDGNTAHVFSAFLGGWTAIPFASPVAAAVGRMVVTLTDSNKVVGVSAYRGIAVTAPPASPSVVIGANGMCGYATDGTNVDAFSGWLDSWSRIPVGPGAAILTVPNRASYVVIGEGAKTTFYSAATGTATPLSTAVAPALSLQDDVAVAIDPVLPFVHCWSGLAGKLVSKVVSAPPTATVKRSYALVQHGTTTEAFSGPLGAFALPLQGNLTFLTEISVALAMNGPTPVAAYSPSVNAWSPAPTVANSAQYLTTCAAAIVDPAGGLHGFSGDSGRWAHVATAPIDSSSSGSAMFCARAGTKLYAFEPRTVRWAEVDVGTPAVAVTCGGQSIVARANNVVWYYCLFADRWTSTTVAGPIAGSMPRDEYGVAYDANTLHVCGGSDQVANFANYPYYWRNLVRGGPITYQVAGQGGDSIYLLINTLTSNVPLPGIGTLLVEPNGALGVPLPQLPASGGLAFFRATLPNDPALSGVVLFAQAAVLHGPSVYLTGRNSIRAF